MTQGELFGGIVGSLVGLRWAPGDSWRERFANVFSGSACSIFVSPGVADWLHISTQGMRSLLAFLIGMFGMSVAASVIDAIAQLKLAKIADSWLSRR